MAEINIAKQLLAARHEKKITQEELPRQQPMAV